MNLDKVNKKGYENFLLNKELSTGNPQENFEKLFAF